MDKFNDKQPTTFASPFPAVERPESRGERTLALYGISSHPTAITSGNIKNGQASADQTSQNLAGASALSGGQLFPAALFFTNQNLPDRAVLTISNDNQNQTVMKIAVQRYSRVVISQRYELRRASATLSCPVSSLLGEIGSIADIGLQIEFVHAL
ncbi:MAG TPA: hypothetical protein PK680_11390 [Novosphingobium sp.]|nr:hypothetical protein [Novosphingobium sp.]HQA18974.1 hypothetical protein [Novosphingobium sp.]